MSTRKHTRTPMAKTRLRVDCGAFQLLVAAAAAGAELDSLRRAHAHSLVAGAQRHLAAAAAPRTQKWARPNRQTSATVTTGSKQVRSLSCCSEFHASGPRESPLTQSPLPLPTPPIRPHLSGASHLCASKPLLLVGRRGTCCGRRQRQRTGPVAVAAAAADQSSALSANRFATKWAHT